MPWGRIDDSLYDHPKLDALGKNRLPAIGLWVICISWSNRYLTDGAVPADRIRRLGGTTALATSLVNAGLLDKTDDGYTIHDFHDFNQTRTEIELERDAARERMREVRANRRANKGRTFANGSGEHTPNTEPLFGRSSEPVRDVAGADAQGGGADVRVPSSPLPARPVPNEGSTRAKSPGNARDVDAETEGTSHRDLDDLPWSVGDPS